jgi:hypothetical protein
VIVNRFDIFNTDPDLTPWVNVEYPTTELEPFRIQHIQPFIGSISIPVFTQVIVGEDREQGLNELDELTNMVLSAVNCDRSLMGTVKITNGFTVAPYEQDNTEEDALFTNQINILAEIFA